MLAAGPATGDMAIALFEVPSSEQSNERSVLLAASSTGPGWKSESIEIEVGAHRFAERTARRKSVLGRALTPLGPDDRSFEVELVDRDQWLLSCDAEALGEGANLAMLGHEAIQFGGAAAIGPGRFRLSELLRARAGTDGKALHEAGELFVLLERDAVRRIAIPEWVAASKITARLAHRGQQAGAEAVLQRLQKGKKGI
jgi:hypothetical protein